MNMKKYSSNKLVKTAIVFSMMIPVSYFINDSIIYAKENTIKVQKAVEKQIKCGFST